MESTSGKMRSRVWSGGIVLASDIPFAEISEYLDREDCLVWVDICDPSGRDLTELAGELALDPLAVEDVVAHLERTKAIRYSTYSVLTAYATRLADGSEDGLAPTVPPAPAGATGTLHSATAEDQRSGPGSVKRRLRPRPPHRKGSRGGGDPDGNVGVEPLLSLHRVSAFVLANGLVTVRQGEGFDIEPVVKHWEANADLLKYGVGALVHGLLDTIVDGHFDAVQLLDDAMEDLEEGLFNDAPRTNLVQRQTYQLRKDLVALRRVSLPMRDLVNTVLRHRHDTESNHGMDASYDDLYDHVLRVAEWTESLRDMVSTIFETNLSLQDARLNTVMKKLTSWAAIIAVPTAITGWFGQNVPYPGFGKETGFIASIALILVIAAALYVSFRRRGWL